MRHGDVTYPARGFAVRESGNSVPVHYRLYHGGLSIGNQLLSRDQHSFAYLGNYVYFTPLKIYAQRYVDNHKNTALGLKSKLFVADARHLPKGTRVIATDPSRFADNHIDLCGLIDLRWELSDWYEELVRIDPGNDNTPISFAHLETGKRLLRNLSQANVLSGKASQCNPKHTSGIPIMLLHQEQDRHGYPITQVIDSLDVFDEDMAFKHAYRNAALFALQEMGSLNLSANQVQYHQQKLVAKRWLERFSVPFEVGMLRRMRTALEDRRKISRREGEGDSISDSSDGLIILVPGPVDVVTEQAPKARNTRHEVVHK